MASATLTGTVKLNTTGLQRGIRRAQRSVANFSRNVSKPIGDAARNMTRLTLAATMFAGVIGGFGVAKAFEFEGMETRFELLCYPVRCRAVHSGVNATANHGRRGAEQ